MQAGYVTPCAMVLYRPGWAPPHSKGEYPAVVQKVREGNLVDLMVFGDQPQTRLAIPWSDDGEAPERGAWRWPDGPA